MINAAAIKIGDNIIYMPAPARHHNILHMLTKTFNGRTDKGYLEEVQGFVTDTGEFLNRKEAMVHAVQCGQGTPRRDKLFMSNPDIYNGPELYSEDLW